MDYQIYTMYVNRKDLLVTALQSLGEYQANAVVLDNSPEQDLLLEDFPGEIVTPCVPLYCSQSYNLIQRLAKQRNQDLFFMMHSDARAAPEIVEALLKRAEELDQEQRKWGVLFTSYDVLCLINAKALHEFHWDPYLPLYYTDIDYYYRLHLAGFELIETYLPVEHMNGGSNTHSDPQIMAYVEANYGAWRHYYMQKWGGERGQERFVTPFNR
jgi:hypothetical protein